MDLPYIGDINLRRNWNLSEKTRRGNRDRQLKYQRLHKYDKKAFRPEDLDKLPQGSQPTWAIHALINANNVICFIAACRADGTIQGIVDVQGKEIDLFHHLCKQREARDIVKGLVRTCRPVGNKARRPSKSGNGHWVGGQNSESLAYWSTF